MAKKRAKRKKIVRKVPMPSTGRRRSLSAAGVGGVSLTDIPPSDVGSVVQSMVNHGASDIRATIQPNGMWTVQKLS